MIFRVEYNIICHHIKYTMKCHNGYTICIISNYKTIIPSYYLISYSYYDCSVSLKVYIQRLMVKLVEEQQNRARVEEKLEDVLVSIRSRE